MRPPIIVWLRQDLRIFDQPAFAAAAKTGKPLILLYILNPHHEGTRELGTSSRWWLHQSLVKFSKIVSRKGADFVLRQGQPLQILQEILKETQADTVYWNRCYEPEIFEQDRRIIHFLEQQGTKVETFSSFLLVEPWELSTKAGRPYQKFAHFWKSLQEHFVAKPLIEAPQSWAPYSKALPGIALDSLDMSSSSGGRSQNLQSAWIPGAAMAQDQLQRFVTDALLHYETNRDFPAFPGTSRLSAHLHFGEISPCQIWHAVQKANCPEPARMLYLKELAWREFNYHLLFHYPSLPQKNLRPTFNYFPWIENPLHFEAWTLGQTGYPMVDAGMRELLQTGFMHNRVRMITASFLTKHLRLPWQMGEVWFWEHLVDADLANNAANWQWVAGSGIDSAPYFRIFNPVLQGEKFDPEGAYVRKYIPELARLPNSWLHKPWLAPQAILVAAQVELGKTYPGPLVDHKQARQQALAAYHTAKQEERSGEG